MNNGKLNIIEVSEDPETPNSTKRKFTKREEAIAKFEHMWRNDPEQFNPFRNAMERERIKRTWELMKGFISLEGKKAVDLGCGSGTLVEYLAQHNAAVLAVDIATQALKVVQGRGLKNVKTSQDYIPNTMLKDDAYDLVISTDVIAFLNPEQYRLYFSEMSRLMHSEAFVVCSTPVDIHSEDAVQRFASMVETEFTIEKWILSYHSLYIRFLDFLSAPSRYVQARQNKEFREKELQQRRSLSNWWFRINSTMIPAAFWKVVNYVLKPIVHIIKQSRFVLLGLERVCRFFSTDTGISHVIFIGKRRPLIDVPSVEELPQERKHRKEVWE